jgi:DNA-binding GntR family transcriptional regulator
MSGRTMRTASVKLTRIHRRNVADDVYDQIRQAILNRSFDPGERLNITAIAKRFDVSQMPV